MADQDLTLEELQTLSRLVDVQRSHLRLSLNDPFPHVRESAQEELAKLAPLAAKLQARVEDGEADDVLLLAD
jgi:hypothetical protein